MSEYDQYVTAVNKIFANIMKMKENWKDSDNQNYIEKIEEYKDIVVESTKLFSKTPTSLSMEELGND